MSWFRRDGMRARKGRRWGPRGLLFVLLCAVLVVVPIWFAVPRLPLVRRALRRMRADPERYNSLIGECARRHGVAPSLVKAVIWKESRFLAKTVGGKGEAGLMQLMEGAVTDWAEAHGRPLPARALWFDPRLNVEIGTWYLARAMNRWREYESMEVLALSQYNAGQTRAARWAPGNPADELPLEGVMIGSTRAYIREIMTRTRHYEQNEARE